jgi:hypothetical protein
MVTRVEDLPQGVLGYRASGKLTANDYRELMKPIYAALDRGETLDIYFELESDWDGLDLGALWEDVKAAGRVGIGHRSSWGRMAIVTDRDWIRHAARAAGSLAPGELRIFAPAEAAQAKAWVAAGQAS